MLYTTIFLVYIWKTTFK